MEHRALVSGFLKLWHQALEQVLQPHIVSSLPQSQRRGSNPTLIPYELPDEVACETWQRGLWPILNTCRAAKVPLMPADRMERRPVEPAAGAAADAAAAAFGQTAKRNWGDVSI
eukprot:CAMPEP_0115481722 /NCGR_PEP_ID=MMETSP0271-20121206/57951_1 /TAXON_ID=71861 /ORGANISM="Scrippsiella trochoidea, Strain CCMP3099" /LENGTH=113 /DNA_ID=CAMNT_0002909479 /DNA_START=191 /DNA_END=532 /DNA_ORIENTATION=-